MFSWIEWVTCGLKPFSFVENSLTQKYSKLENISIKTMKKYMNLLTKKVEVEIANIAPENFAIIFDRWSNGSTHDVALSVSYPNNASENELQQKPTLNTYHGFFKIFFAKI